MAKKNDMFYFENFREVAAICVEAAEYLVKCLTDYAADKTEERMLKMHEYEHAADDKKHQMSEALSKAFITPLEREDLAELSSKLDEVADHIEEVFQRFYVDEPARVTAESILFAQKIAACCKAMEKMFEELPHYKKPAKIFEAIVEINDLEEECDKIYINAYRNARKVFDDMFEAVSWRKIYDYLERCADACEHVADTVDVIIMKNS